VSRAQAFYEALGWQLDSGIDDESDHIAFFQTDGSILSLWDRAKLAEDSGVTDSGGWGGATLAYAVGSPAEVDAVIADAKAAGARITRVPGDTFWGG
jgi:catechol 2,3-dioxygenase-like lactoylglutathione lyase family enzyme